MGGTPPRYVRSPATYQQILARIHAEYVEMPGMRLTLDQLLRLCGIDRSTCRRVLEELVTRKFLAVTPDGMYVRRE
jgi:DNA-binding IclR family transcriptional regulator